MARATQTYVLEREVPLPRGRVWELLSNTDHLNRALGLAPVNFSDVAAGDSTLVRQASSRMLGFVMRWEEYPFQWVREQSYSVLRVYSAGPLDRLLGGIELRDAGDATLLRCYAKITPRGQTGATAARWIARRMMRKTFDYCRHYIELAANAVQFRLPQPSNNSPADEGQLAFLSSRLRQNAAVPVQQAEMLTTFLREAGDDEVASIRPYQLADNWGADRDDILRLCLHATRAGMLNLSWNLMCPNCRVPKATYGSLNQISNQLHCDLCEVSYDADFDRYVELRFAVHPSLRAVTEHVYCIGNPFAAPHVLVQHRVEPGQSVCLPCFSGTGGLRLRVLRSNASVPLEPDRNGYSYHFTDDCWTVSDAGRDDSDTLSVCNATDQAIVVAIEKVDWDPAAATAYRVTTLPEFRTMFGSEVLAPGQHVSVQHLTLLFSDLRDSTALYESIGDAPAYGSVRRHFDYMFERIERHHGSIVKTIGDAVMAVFFTPEDALKAALEIQKDIAALNALLGGGETIVIKLGLHHGPAIAVNSNDRLDYFGRTVNIAARIGGASTGHDIVLSEASLERQGVQDLLAEQGAAISRFQANLKGIEGVFTLYRVVPEGSVL